MSLPALLTPTAAADLETAAGWIAEDNPAAARALRMAIHQAAVRIGTFPKLGSLCPGVLRPGQRLLTLPPWPYLVIYREDSSRPRILRILHSVRNLPPLLRDATET